MLILLFPGNIVKEAYFPGQFQDRFQQPTLSQLMVRAYEVAKEFCD